jgi:hypothetical protein
MSRIDIDRCLRAAATAATLTVCLVLGACADRMNREDFSMLIRGKTEQEVLKNTGKPSKTEEPSADRHVWTYNSRTFDVSNHNKFDDKTIVIFAPSAEGKMVVAEVKFE